MTNFASNGAVSANKLFGNYFSNRSYSVDTVFEGSNTAGNARVQYMRYDFTNEVIQLAKPLTMTYNTKLKWGMNSFVETTSETVPVTRFEAPNSSRVRDQKILINRSKNIRKHQKILTRSNKKNGGDIS